MKVAIWIILGIVVLTITGLSRMNADKTVAQPAAAAMTQKILEADAQTLTAAYEENEVKADMAYKGKTLRITGIVDKIGTDIIDDAYIIVGTGKEFEHPQIQCYFMDVEEVNKVADLLAGDEVIIEGICDGTAVVNIQIKDCSVIKIK